MGPSKESPREDNIVRTPDIDYHHDPRGVGYVFFHQMLKHKEKTAQIDGLTGKKDTFGELHQRCLRSAITMRKKGVTSVDFISLCTLNSLDTPVPLIAALFVGAKVASVDPRLSQADTVSLLKQVNPRMLFVIPEAVEMIEKALAEIGLNSEIVVLGESAKHTPFSEFLQPSDEEETFKPAEARSLQDTAMVFFSSGTSGFPKGICHSHYSVMITAGTATNSASSLDLTLGHATPYWLAPIVFMAISIMLGTARLIVPKFDLNVIWKVLHKYEVTLAFLNPVQALIMRSTGRPKGIDLSSLKAVVIAGGCLMEDQMVKIREIFPETLVYLEYGMTEMTGGATIFDLANPKHLEFIRKKPGSSGYARDGIWYKIADTETEEALGPNRHGELRIKAKGQLTGYYNRDDSDVWDSDGFLKTGDLAYYDEDYCFYVVDRVKEIFKFQGWHIVPAVLEDILLTHPAVAIALVIGIPHELDGELPTALVILKGSAGDVSPKEIEKYVEERVHDRQRLRGGVKIVKELLTTPSGKISRRKIRDLVIQGII